MIERCLFCRGHYRENHVFRAIPRGQRIAYDPVQGRLWVICGRCFRWTLQPVEEREAALYELERAVRDHGSAVARTANIELHYVGQALLVRVGAAALPERAWWRHGRELRRRRAAFDSTASRVTGYTMAALRRVGDLLGLADPEVEIHWDDDPLADILRWRRFGWAAWHGRVRCPYCNSTLRALTYDLSWWVYPLLTEDGDLQLGVPCPRCDPWTPEHIYRIDGPEAPMVLQRVLAYQNVSGATEGTITAATRAIEEAGSPGEFTRDAVDRRQSLWKMGTAGSVALEIALAESSEQRLLDMDAQALEFLWRREDELARIMDEELTPRRVLMEHLRRLPVRLRRERVPRILQRPAPGSSEVWEPGRG